MTRCCWPPESSWGRAPRRFVGLGQAHQVQEFEDPLPGRLAGASPLCTRSTSLICRSMLCSGFREVIGSWKIMAM